MPSYKTVYGSFLKQEDLGGREVRVVIDSVELEKVKGEHGDEQKLVAHFVGKDKGMILNRGNADVLAALAGTDDYEQWGGTRAILYVDPTVRFGNKVVGGLRLKAPGTGTATHQAQTQAQRRPEPEEFESPEPPPQRRMHATEPDDDPIPF